MPISVDEQNKLDAVLSTGQWSTAKGAASGIAAVWKKARGWKVGTRKSYSVEQLLSCVPAGSRKKYQKVIEANRQRSGIPLPKSSGAPVLAQDEPIFRGGVLWNPPTKWIVNAIPDTFAYIPIKVDMVVPVHKISKSQQLGIYADPISGMYRIVYLPSGSGIPGMLFQDTAAAIKVIKKLETLLEYGQNPFALAREYFKKYGGKDSGLFPFGTAVDTVKLPSYTKASEAAAKAYKKFLTKVLGKTKARGVLKVDVLFGTASGLSVGEATAILKTRNNHILEIYKSISALWSGKIPTSGVRKPAASPTAQVATQIGTMQANIRKMMKARAKRLRAQLKKRS